MPKKSALNNPDNYITTPVESTKTIKPISGKYFYRLGHCNDLAIAEYFALASKLVSKTSPDGIFRDAQDDKVLDDDNFSIKKPVVSYDAQYLMSDQLMDANDFGSMIFVAEVVAEVDVQKTEIKEDFRPKFLTKLDEYLEEVEFKKVGFYLPTFDKKVLFPIGKKHCNRVDILDNLPNFGYWKKTKNWLVSIKFGTTIYLCKIISYSDQEFWSEIDQGLPQADMSRGIINLKLARSMMNLTACENIWDNFAGQGRVLVAGMDSKKIMYASDLDPIVETQLYKNYEFAKHFWSNQNYNKQIVESTGELITNFTLDATKIIPADIAAKGFKNQELAIVTEGYLGTNFRKYPTKKEILEQVNKVNEIWKNVLLSNTTNNTNGIEINEIVGCVPFYPKFQDERIEGQLQDRNGYVPEYTFWFSNPDWTLVQLTPDVKTINYKRDNSNVGHLIFKMVRA
jgi:hypothetical protein